jgi:crotonobetainyl-CoA:carnitine CoA-transferase CaiB-like acyl-CoA transferase
MAGDRIALTPIKRIDEVVTDRHLRARGMFVQVPFGDVGVEVFGSPMKLSSTPARTTGAVPQLGQHNREVYVDWLGIDLERFEALRSAGVI